MTRHILSRGKGGEYEEPTVNLTPLIDVVFVILIMFIIVAPLLEMENIKLADSSPAGKDVQSLSREAGPIAIQVFSDDTIKFNSIPVSVERLGDMLIEAKGKHPHVSPQLFQDKRAAFGTYQSVKNALEVAGFDEMDLVLKPSG
ncbi:MAG: biopolymer transporter ExbD [Chlamydiota bacterium]|nr:biopolymer transporter ExbD [Chlamydiota bacterium]